MWWQELFVLQQVTFIIGCATLAFMIIQIILMLIGFSDDDAFTGADDVDIDAGDLINDEGISHIGLKLISVRTVIAFLCLGSFAVFFTLFYLPHWAAILIGIGVGGAAGVLMGLAINAIAKMQDSGNININNSIGKIGEVYLTIPSARSGQGKVNVVVQERLTEFDAVTDSPEPIKTGLQIKVLDVINNRILLVEPLSISKTE